MTYRVSVTWENQAGEERLYASEPITREAAEQLAAEFAQAGRQVDMVPAGSPKPKGKR